ncbi:hypothetical protein MtrunA17_Chr3g0094891 [Medicago truncatula]|uniref:Uncharacterized protein n=1 Tax=Medicago truncatula TaxID=3880 RepID=A0A396IS24_MEDTR|nr:hypothetical protein MtrunA17_Chr3g0094891 [Medicago truncatula]
MFPAYIYFCICYKLYWRFYENKLKIIYEYCHKLFSYILPNRITKFMLVDKLN